MPSGKAHVDYLAAVLTAGRYDLLVEEYADPLTIYMPGQAPMVATRSNVWGFFQSFHSALVAGGMTQLSARVVADGLPQGGRALLWADWFGEGADQPRQRVAQTVCYRRIAGASSLTELPEFKRLDLPMLAAA